MLPWQPFLIVGVAGAAVYYLMRPKSLGRRRRPLPGNRNSEGGFGDSDVSGLTWLDQGSHHGSGHHGHSSDGGGADYFGGGGDSGGGGDGGGGGSGD